MAEDYCARRLLLVDSPQQVVRVFADFARDFASVFRFGNQFVRCGDRIRRRGKTCHSTGSMLLPMNVLW